MEQKGQIHPLTLQTHTRKKIYSFSRMVTLSLWETLSHPALWLHVSHITCSAQQIANRIDIPYLTYKILHLNYKTHSFLSPPSACYLGGPRITWKPWDYRSRRWKELESFFKWALILQEAVTYSWCCWALSILAGICHSFGYSWVDSQCKNSIIDHLILTFLTKVPKR